MVISELNTWPVSTPVNASPASLRMQVHDSEPKWCATPFLCGSLIRYSMPVYLGASLITLSARKSRDCGIVTPICFAVARFTTSSYLVGCSTGSSAGLVPFRTCQHTNASEQFSKAWAISQKAPRFGKSTLPENRWQPTVDCKVCDLFLVPQKKDGWEYYETVSAIFRRAYKRFVKLVATSHFQDFQPDFQNSGRILRRYQRLSPGDRRPEDP